MADSRTGMQEPNHQVDSKIVHSGKSQQAQGIHRSEGMRNPGASVHKLWRDTGAVSSGK